MVRLRFSALHLGLTLQYLALTLFFGGGILSLFFCWKGGIYTLPSYLSAEAKHLLSSMLVVDPVKRITIADIRQLPWFQKGLPTYLQPLPPTPAAEPAGFNFGPIKMETISRDSEQREDDMQSSVAPDIGVVEPAIVDELTEKMVGYSKEEVLQQLLEDSDNQVKVAYQLVHDHRRMLQVAHLDNKEDMSSFLAQSPPPWNAGMDGGLDRSTSVRQKERRTRYDSQQAPATPSTAQSDTFGDDTMMTEHDVGNMTDDVTTEAGQSDEEDSATDFDDLFADDDDLGEEDAKSSGIAVLKTSLPSMRPSVETPSTEDPPSLQQAHIPLTPARRARSRWHFGIRSRSPPMEIMLELYRTLQVLGMEWREKPFDKKQDAQDFSNEGSSQDKAPSGKASSDAEKASGKSGTKHEASSEPLYPRSEELFFVETRWTVQNIVVRMNLQLYRVDESNYLVDFRHVGCKSIAPQAGPTAPHIDATAAADEAAGMSSPTVSSSPGAMTSSPAAQNASGSTSVRSPAEGIGGVGSGGGSSLGQTAALLDGQSLHAALETAYQQSSDQNTSGFGNAVGVSGSTPKAPRTKASLSVTPVDGNTEICSPFLFLECATRLIIELAGGG